MTTPAPPSLRHGASDMKLQTVCSNRPRPSVSNDYSKGHQWWAREVYHARVKDAPRTICGHDASEWLPMDTPIITAMTDHHFCKRCKSAIAKARGTA